MAETENTTDESSEPDSRIQRVLRTLDRNATLVVGLTAVLVAAVIGVISLRFAMKDSLPLPTAQALLGMAHQQYRSGDYDTCIKLLEEFHARNRTSVDTETMLGNAYFRMGQLAKAEQHYKAALELNEYAGMALMNLALACHRQGRTDEALAHYRHARDLYEGRNSEIAERASFCLSLLESTPYALNDSI